MGIFKHLDENARDIVKGWIKDFSEDYSTDGSRFILNEKNPFNNPIGAMAHESFSEVFRVISGKKSPDAALLREKLDPIIRLRAVQTFIPSDGVAFVFKLKDVVRGVLKNKIKAGDISGRELDLFDQRVDELALAAFDIYMACREQIYRLRASEVRTRTLNVLKTKDILCEVPEVGTEIIPHDVYKNGGFEKPKDDTDRGL